MGGNTLYNTMEITFVAASFHKRDALAIILALPKLAVNDRREVQKKTEVTGRFDELA